MKYNWKGVSINFWRGADSPTQNKIFKKHKNGKPAGGSGRVKAAKTQTLAFKPKLDSKHEPIENGKSRRREALKEESLSQS